MIGVCDQCLKEAEVWPLEPPDEMNWCAPVLLCLECEENEVEISAEAQKRADDRNEEAMDRIYANQEP